MNREEAVAWLTERKWIVTEQRVSALVSGVDLVRDTGGCTTWSDNGPCQTCIEAAQLDGPN